MNFKFNEKKKKSSYVLQNDFVLCNTPPENIMKILTPQKSRILNENMLEHRTTFYHNNDQRRIFLYH